MHTMWKGSVSFGLVNIPVRMFAATEDKDVRFKILHRKCRTPIKQERFCPHCNEKVGPDDVVRGFEYEPGRFVLIDDEDLEAIKPATARTAEILDFVDLREIDPIYFDKSYYLAPQDTGGWKAYALLCEAMKSTGKIAVARITIRNKQSLAVIRAYGNILILETIFYPDEVRPVTQVPDIPENVKIDDREMEMARQLIESLTSEFRPEKYRDDYRENLLELIRKKAGGEEIVSSPEAPQRNVVDLMAALQESLRQAQELRKHGKAPAGGKKPRKGKKEPAEVG
jgi:Ku protein, prokaryotic